MVKNGEWGRFYFLDEQGGITVKMFLRTEETTKNILNSAFAIFCGVWDGWKRKMGKWKYHDKAILKWKKQK